MKKTIRDIDVAGKKVFVRVDYNVPINSELKIVDDTRIVATLPTIRYLTEHGAKVILCSHLGRPNGQVDTKLSLRPVLARLSKLLEKPVSFAEDILDKSVIHMVLSAVDAALSGFEQADMLKRAFSQLGEEAMQIIRMRYFENMSQREVAGQLGVSQMTVSRLERKALTQLREAMKIGED